MSGDRFPQVKSLPDAEALRHRLVALAVDLPVDDTGPCPALAAPAAVAGLAVGNRFAVLPMEGWDGTLDGRPTELVERRWRRFGASGAKLVWGGEAVAVAPEGRANPNQLCIGPDSTADLRRLRVALHDAHAAAGHEVDDLVVGLQLTHSGRWARPSGTRAPRIGHRHPVLDPLSGVDGDGAVLTDDELTGLIDRLVEAAGVAEAAGFDFVDVKCCHGYLLHELLSGFERPGPFGGALEHRARVLLEAVAAIRDHHPDLAIGVRLSVFDLPPHGPGPTGRGEPRTSPDGSGAPPRFGVGPDGQPDLTEALVLAGWLDDLGVSMLCVTAGSPYYVPHIQRPAYFPPSDGYQAPEDPLVGVARLLAASRRVKQEVPGLFVVASGLSYLQDHLPNVVEPLVRDGWADAVGVGRMVLSYPELPADVLAGRSLDRRRICRTFSDCTTAPRHGLVSGCYPLDDFYKARPERVELARVKRELRRQGP